MKKLEILAVLILFVIIGLFLLRGFELRKERERYDDFIGEGSSMEPTLSDGDSLLVDTKRKAEEDDLIVFDCPMCNFDGHETSIMVKRLISINEEGCFWVEGDNKEVSLDSRDYRVGWLCPEDIDFLGVVKKITKKQEK